MARLGKSVAAEGLAQLSERVRSAWVEKYLTTRHPGQAAKRRAEPGLTCGATRVDPG